MRIAVIALALTVSPLAAQDTEPVKLDKAVKQAEFFVSPSSLAAQYETSGRQADRKFGGEWVVLYHCDVSQTYQKKGSPVAELSVNYANAQIPRVVCHFPKGTKLPEKNADGVVILGFVKAGEYPPLLEKCRIVDVGGAKDTKAAIEAELKK